MFESAEFIALWLSFRVAFLATVLGLPLAVFLAHVLARHTFRGKTALDLIIHAPLVLPPVVIGYFLLVTFAPNGAVGGFLENTLGLKIAFTWQGAALASLIMALPLMVRAIRLSFEAENPKLALAARTLGASPFRTFFDITLPLAAPGLITGGLLGFARPGRSKQGGDAGTEFRFGLQRKAGVAFHHIDNQGSAHGKPPIRFFRRLARYSERPSAANAKISEKTIRRSAAASPPGCWIAE